MEECHVLGCNCSQHITKDQKDSLDKFIEENEDAVKNFGLLRKYADSRKFLLTNHHLLNQDAEVILSKWCIDLALDNKFALMQHIVHQSLSLGFIMQDVNKSPAIDPRNHVLKFYENITDPAFKSAFDVKWNQKVSKIIKGTIKLKQDWLMNGPMNCIETLNFIYNAV